MPVRLALLLPITNQRGNGFPRVSGPGLRYWVRTNFYLTRFSRTLRTTLNRENIESALSGPPPGGLFFICAADIDR